MKSTLVTISLILSSFISLSQSFTRDSNYYYKSNDTYLSQLHQGNIYTYGGQWGVDRTVRLQRIDLRKGKPIIFSNGTNVLPLNVNNNGNNIISRFVFLADTIGLISYSDQSIYISKSHSDGTPLLSIERDMKGYNSLSNARVQGFRYFMDNGKFSGFYTVLDSQLKKEIFFFKEVDRNIIFRENLGFISTALNQDSTTIQLNSITILDNYYYGIISPRFNGGTQKHSVFKLNSDFKLDLSFGLNGISTIPIKANTKTTVTSLPSGSILIDQPLSTVYYTPQGKIDSTKGTNGILIKPVSKPYQLDPNTHISFNRFYIIDGKSHRWNAELRDSSNNLITTFGKDGYWPGSGTSQAMLGYLKNTWMLDDQTFVLETANYFGGNWSSYFYKYYIPGYTLRREKFPSFGNLVLYPNPAKEVLHISTNLSNRINYAIYDTYSKIVQDGTTHNSLIGIERLSSGLYVLRLQVSDKNYITRQFIKQ